MHPRDDETDLAVFASQGRIVNNNTVPAGAAATSGQVFYISEQGGLQRWFNLTITNVGPEAVADYTCVAVNAGGVMEEDISLTFNDPEAVSSLYLNHMPLCSAWIIPFSH